MCQLTLAKVRRLPEPVRKVCRFLHVKYVKSLGLEALGSVCGLDSKEDGHERQCHDVSVEVCCPYNLAGVIGTEVPCVTE